MHGSGETAEDFCHENTKTLKEEIEKKKRCYRINIPPMFMHKRNIVKMASSLEATYRFNATHIKIPMVFFIGLGGGNLKINIKARKAQNS